MPPEFRGPPAWCKQHVNSFLTEFRFDKWFFFFYRTLQKHIYQKPLNTIRIKELQVAAQTSLPSTGAAHTAATGVSTSVSAPRRLRCSALSPAPKASPGAIQTGPCSEVRESTLKWCYASNSPSRLPLPSLSSAWDSEPFGTISAKN